jgi:hypothetical protein
VKVDNKSPKRIKKRLFWGERKMLPQRYTFVYSINPPPDLLYERFLQTDFRKTIPFKVPATLA